MLCCPNKIIGKLTPPSLYRSSNLQFYIQFHDNFHMITLLVCRSLEIEHFLCKWIWPNSIESKQHKMTPRRKTTGWLHSSSEYVQCTTKILILYYCDDNIKWRKKWPQPLKDEVSHLRPYWSVTYDLWKGTPGELLLS